MKLTENKIQKPNGLLSISLFIVVLVYSLCALIEMILYYTGSTQLKQSFPVSSFLSAALLGLVVIMMVSKGKTLLATVFFLLTLIIERGLSFIRTSITGTISMSTFDGFYNFLVFAIMVYLIILLVIQLKNGLPKIEFKHPKSFILPLIAIVFYLIFISFNATLSLVLILVILFWFEEENFVSWFIAARFMFAVTNIIDFFIVKNAFPGFNQNFGVWLQNILALGIFVLAVISIFSPDLLVMSKSKNIESNPNSNE